MDKKYIPGWGPIGAKLMLLGDCPTTKDEYNGRCFTDTRELYQLLPDVGININSCWKTTVSKFHVPPNLDKKKKIPFHVRAKNAGIDIEQQVRELQEEINGIKPNCILALGGSALWALSGKYQIGDYRGSIMFGMGTKFVPTYNPAHLSWQAKDVEFIGYWNRQIIAFDMRRAYAQSAFPDLRLPSRNLEICRNSAQLAEYRQRYKSNIRMSVDIEANGTCIPVCIGLAHNKHHGMTVPLWNVEGISTIPDADLVQIGIILSEML